MKRLLAFFAITAVGGASLFAADTEKLKEQERLDSATKVLQELANTPDKGIPQNIASAAKCVAVVPGLKKGALGWGGQYGQGFATCRTGNGRFSAPAPIRMAGGSWGLQIGGQSSDIVMLAMDQKGMEDMLSAKFKIGGDASAAAGPVGRHAEAATDWKLDTELLTYNRSKGLFAGISLSGTEVSQNDEDTRALYGRDIPFRTLLNGQTAVPSEAREFVNAVNSYFAEAKTGDNTPATHRKKHTASVGVGGDVDGHGGSVGASAGSNGVDAGASTNPNNNGGTTAGTGTDNPR